MIKTSADERNRRGASLAALREELWSFYRNYSIHGRQETPHRLKNATDIIWREVDAYADASPNIPAVLLKAHLIQTIADTFEPVLFLESPFFYEMGLRPAENWGVPTPACVGSWLIKRNQQKLVDEQPALQNLRHFGLHCSEASLRLWFSANVFDVDHHCLGYTKIMRQGIYGLIHEIKERRKKRTTNEQAIFLEAAERSAYAVIKIAARFADKAENMLESGKYQQTRFLKMIAETARKVPAQPPSTFYEGLATLWFLREVTATVEGLGVSVVGHPDRMLINLYRQDLKQGRISKDDARDLIARWMLPTDMKFHVWDNSWPETSTCIELGGCTSSGKPLFNELTRMFVEVHRDSGLLNPKLNCRFSSASADEYLELLSESVLEGHNVFAFLNDDTLIPACMRMGKSEAEARNYVNGGCQETIVEGVEHSAGAYYYFNLPRVLDICLNSAEPVGEEFFTEAAAKAVPTQIESATTFEDFLQQFLKRLKWIIGLGADWRREAAGNWPQVHPAPFFSAMLEGCLKQAADYTTGSAKYNPGGIAYVGFATLVDSLYTIRKAVFDERWLTLTELKRALAADWQGHVHLHYRVLSLPKFGHGNSEVDALAARLAADLAAWARILRNERGGPFQASFFVYYSFVTMAKQTRATPDGRYTGDVYSQGIAPSRLHPPANLTDIFHSMGAIDFKDYPGNAVLDLQLPAGGGISPRHLSQLMRTFASMGGPTLQLNCTSVEQLKDAQKHPEKYSDLTVRIAGLSAKFVCLTPDVQNEIIQRLQVNMT